MSEKVSMGAEQKRDLEKEAAFAKIALGKKKKKKKEWGDDFIEELQGSIVKMRTRVPLKVMVFFTRQLATMFAAGLTLEKSVSNLSIEEKNPKFKKALENISDDIRKGYSLSDAMEKHPGIFSTLYVALVKAGEVSGSLQDILDELANYLENISDTNQKVVSALTYPFLVLGFLIVVILVMLIKIVPSFADVYAQLGSKLPGPTQKLVDISELVQNNWLGVLLAFGLFLIVMWFIGLTKRGGYAIDSFKLNFPVFGTLLKYTIFNKFSKTMGILLGAGVPVIPSMMLLQRIVDNKVYAASVKLASEYIRDGYTISASLRITERFPSIMLQLLTTGEETGEIDNLLHKTSDFYSKQIDAIVNRMTSIIEPVMIIFVGGLILLILVITYLPIFYMGQAMRSGL